MKLKVLGPRILVKVKKFNEDAKYEGTSILMPEVQKDMETVNQSVGEVVQVGQEAYMNKVVCPSGNPWVKVGDIIHFSRYGAMRINTKQSKDADCEYWVLMDKDPLVIEEATDHVV